MVIEIGDIIAVVLSVTALVFSVHTYISGVKHDRRQNTLEAFNQLQKQALDKLYNLSPTEIKEIIKDHRSERYKEISTYVARIGIFVLVYG